MEKISHTDNMMVPIYKTCFELIFQWKLYIIIFKYHILMDMKGYKGLPLNLLSKLMKI